MAIVTSSGTITAVSTGVSFTPDGPFRLHITGTWVATLALQVSADGSTYDTITTYTTNPDPAPRIWADRGLGTYRLYATAYTSGTATVSMASV